MLTDSETVIYNAHMLLTQRRSLKFSLHTIYVPRPFPQDWVDVWTIDPRIGCLKVATHSFEMCAGFESCVVHIGM